MSKRVLFVDDTESILFGYKKFCKMLFNDEWRFFFASDGAEAIDIIESYEIDMVVSDLDMPFYDGVHLMDYIVSKVPHIIRVIVSGTTSEEKRTAVIKSAHQFFEKPAIPGALKNMFHRILYLDTLLVSQKARNFIHSLGTLPVLPAAFRELHKECESPDFSLHSCGEIVAKDVALSANILKIVNSSFFDIPNRVHSPEQAVSLLGVNIIKAFIIQCYIYDNFGSGHDSPLSIEQFTQDSFKRAKIAKHLAKFQGESSSRVEKIYVTTLLHNIGSLILNYKQPRIYGQILEDSKQLELPVSELEKTYFRCSHEEVGAYILGLWGFDQEVLEAVVAHHSPSKSHRKSHDLLDYIYAADHLFADLDSSYSYIVPEDTEYAQFRNLLPKLKEWREISF